MVASAAWALAELGETREALNRLEEGQRLHDRRAPELPGMGLWGCVALGRACVVLGRLDDAERLANTALEPRRSPFAYAADPLHLLGQIAAHTDRFDADRARQYYDKALALAEVHGLRPLVAHCHLGLGKLYGRTGKRVQAQEHLTTATTMYREMGMQFWLEKAEAEMND